MAVGSNGGIFCVGKGWVERGESNFTGSEAAARKSCTHQHGIAVGPLEDPKAFFTGSLLLRHTCMYTFLKVHNCQLHAKNVAKKLLSGLSFSVSQILVCIAQ